MFLFTGRWADNMGGGGLYAVVYGIAFDYILGSTYLFVFLFGQLSLSLYGIMSMSYQ